MAEDKTVFSKAAIIAKQKEQQEEYEKRILEARQMFEAVADTEAGEKILTYLFLLCGGDRPSVQRNKEGTISMDETLLTLGARSVWESIRFHMKSDTLKKIERHNWETQK